MNQEMPTLKYTSNPVLPSPLSAVDQETLQSFTAEPKNKAEKKGILIFSVPGKQRRQWEGMD